MAEYPYLEKCVEAAAYLNRSWQELASRKPGKRLGASDSYRVQSIGSGVIGMGQSLALTPLGTIRFPISRDLAIKIPRDKSDPMEKLRDELPAIDEIVRRAPSLRKKVPAFVILLAVEDADNPAALITEDATYGGKLPIEETAASESARKALVRAFPNEDGEVVASDVLANSLAFDVDGTERWLDFTPPPIYASDPDALKIVEDEVNARRDELTLTVPADSPLGLSLSSV
ncbi:MAG TPA: hypothetical protein VFX86_01835 [Candidatus Saccharimonadales bacterium]|nr:hypothetical protein [Candidatus Saccharimonadales bacterium]